MMLYALDHPVKDPRSFGCISIWDASFCKQLNVHIKNVYRVPSWRRAICIQKAAMIRAGQRTCKQPRMSTEVQSSTQSAIYTRTSRCMEEGCEIMEPIWTLCLNEITKLLRWFPEERKDGGDCVHFTQYGFNA